MLQMTGKSEQVKLLVYEMHGNEIVVDSIKAKEFSDFILIELGPSVKQDQIDQMVEAIETAFQKMDKQILIVPYEAEIGFYGFKEADSTELSE